MKHFHAGWNMAGYLPETPYGVFAEVKDAADYLISEIERDYDFCSCHGSELCDNCSAVAAIKSALRDGDAENMAVMVGDFLVYCIQSCEETGVDHDPEAEPEY